jgi:hypothetical protein
MVQKIVVVGREKKSTTQENNRAAFSFLYFEGVELVHIKFLFSYKRNFIKFRYNEIERIVTLIF